MLHAMGRTSVAEPKIFSTHVGEIVLEVRTALGQMLAACGVSPQAVQRAYGQLHIDKKLAWRLGKVLQSDDPYVAARHIPGAAGMRALFDHARAEGIPAPVLERAREAIDRFDDFADAHARSRRAFDLMLSAHAASNLEEIDVIHRKEATIPQSYIWGVFAEAQLNTCIARVDESGLIDAVSISGYINLQWVRPNVGWVVKRGACCDDDGKPRSCPLPEPLDPTTRPGEVPLLKKYCSPVLPPMRRVRTSAGFMIDELVQDNVGTSSAATCVIAEIQRGWIPAFRDAHNRSGAYIAKSRTPCHMFLYDVLFHPDTLADVDPELLVFGDLEFGYEAAGVEHRSRHRLMPWKTLEDLGCGITRAYTSHFPPYVDMLADCFKHLGWDPAEFRLFRAAIEYPIIPSSVAIRYDLPERPT